MLNIETIKSVVPAVNIKSINLGDPKSSAQDGTKISVRIKASAITTANDLSIEQSGDNAFLAVPGLNFNSHLGVAIIQSTNSDLTSLLRGYGSKLLKYIGPTNGWNGTDNFDAILRQKISKQDFNGNTSDFKSKYMKVLSRPLFGDIKAPILEKIDNDGRTIKTVPLEFEYSLEQYSPEHLTYFAISYLDVEGIVSELSTNSLSLNDDGAQTLGLDAADLQNLVGFSSPMKNDTVFESGVISSNTFFFQLPDGNFWTGEVVSDGSATLKTDTGIPLTTKKVNNIKIQDFRTKKGLETAGVMDDFQGEKRTLDLIIAGLKPQIRQVDPSNSKSYSYVSDLFLSAGPRKNAKFMFMINFEELILKNSVYGNLWKTNYGNIKSQVLDRSWIRTIKVFRQQVEKVLGTNSVGSPIEKYIPTENSLPQLVAVSGQKQTFSKLSSVPNFEENEDISFSNSDHIRSFSITDQGIPTSSNSLYRYRIELDAIDGSQDFLRERVKDLRQFSFALQNYLSDVVNSAVRGEEIIVDDPHVVDNVNTVSRTEGYDPRYDNLTQNFAIKMNNKYGEDISAGIDKFLRTIELFSENGSFPSENTSEAIPLTETGARVTTAQIQTFLEVVLDANRVTPESIMSVLNDVNSTTSKIFSFIGEDVSDIDPTSNKAATVSRGAGSGAKNVISTAKDFEEIFDVSKNINGAYDYLSSNTDSVIRQDNGTGLRTISGQEFRKRTQLETLKYFTNTDPVITAGVTAGKDSSASGAKIPIRTSTMSYLSPSQVIVGDPRKQDNIVDFLNESSPDLATIVESKLIANISTSQRNGVPLSDETFSKMVSDTKNNSGKSAGNRSSANSLQTFYLSQNQSLTPNTKEKPQVQSDRTLPKSKEPTNEEDQEFIYKGNESDNLLDGGKIVDDNSSNSANLPASLYQSLFQKNVSRAPTGMSSDMFNMNNPNNFLAGKTQQEISLLPNQIKAFFQSNTANQSDVRLNNLAKIDMINSPQYGSIASFDYKTLVSLEYLEGFGSSKPGNSAGEPLSSPRWARLDESVFSSFVGKKILCRLTSYKMPNSEEMGFLAPKEVEEVETYDKYFIIKPDIPITTPAASPIRKPRFEIRKSSFGKSKYDDSSEFGHTRIPTRPSKLVNPKVLDSIKKLKNFSQSLKENRIVDAFHSVGSTSRKSSSGPLSSKTTSTSRNSVLMAQKQKAQQRLGEINRKTTTLSEDIRKKEAEKASLAVSISNHRTTTGSASEKSIQEANLKFNSVSQEVAALKKKPAENESAMVALNKEIEAIDAELAIASVPTPKTSIKVVDTNAASQIGEPDESFSSTESLIAGYESLVTTMETEAQNGVVRQENVEQLEKFSGYLNIPDTSVKEFEEEIGNIVVASDIATSNSDVVFQNPEEIESNKVTTTAPRTAVSRTAGRRK